MFCYFKVLKDKENNYFFLLSFFILIYCVVFRILMYRLIIYFIFGNVYLEEWDQFVKQLNFFVKVYIKDNFLVIDILFLQKF